MWLALPNAGAAQADKEKLLAAVEKLAHRKATVWEGSVSAKADNVAFDAGGGARAVVIHGGVKSAKPFAGEFEFWVQGKEMAAVSNRRLPGVAFYDNGERALVQTTVEDEAVDPQPIAHDLPQLIRPKSLRDMINEAKDLKTTVADGHTVFSFTADKRFLKPAQNSLVNELTGSQVQEIGLDVTCGPDGEVRQLSFRVVQKNQMRSIMEMAKKGKVQIQGHGNDELQKQIQEQMEEAAKKGTPGPTTVINLKFTDREPSARLREIVSRFQKEFDE
jgi:hypothetical protein